MHRTALFVSSALLSTTITLAIADTHYVNVNNPSPSEPYTSWESASNDIQSAIDAVSAGDTVLVTNGVYLLTQEIYVDKAIS